MPTYKSLTPIFCHTSKTPHCDHDRNVKEPEANTNSTNTDILTVVTFGFAYDNNKTSFLEKLSKPTF
ncbi:MAG: hypothetical protein WAM14_17255 [Candidatus Nitrosopolaris sp.]